MIAVRMVKVPIDEVVDVVAVRHLLVAACIAMAMHALVLAASMVRRARGRVLVRHVEPMLVDSLLGRVVQAAIVQVVRMPVMPNARVPAVRTVQMRVILMLPMPRLHADRKSVV